MESFFFFSCILYIHMNVWQYQYVMVVFKAKWEIFKVLSNAYNARLLMVLYFVNCLYLKRNTAKTLNAIKEMSRLLFLINIFHLENISRFYGQMYTLSQC